MLDSDDDGGGMLKVMTRNGQIKFLLPIKHITEVMY